MSPEKQIMGTNPALVTQNLSRRFGEIVAVENLTLEIQPGEVFGFLGHNGAGKTTTVRLLNGVLEPSAGYARVLGMDPVADGPTLRRSTGVLTETPSLDERLTGLENLQIYGELYGVPRAEVRDRVDGLLHAFGLGDRAGERVGNYSKGMKQRLALARALLHRPDLLFLDEPTAGLDPVASRRVHDMIGRISREEGRTVLLCTHNLAEAQKLCDRVAVLENGRLAGLGTPLALAQKLGRSQRLEIEVAREDLSAALSILRSIGGLSEIEQRDGVITALGADREMIADLVASLAAADVRIYRVSPQEPSLEDIYFALHEAQEKAL